MMLSFDLTGADPAYRRTGVQFRVFELGQPLQFGEPVFADSVIVRWVEDGSGTVHELVEGVSWEHLPANRDFAAMSAARLQDNLFEAELINGIYNKEVFAGSRTYVVEYQALQLAPSEYDYGPNGPTPNPGLMEELITTTRFLRDIKDPINEITSITVDTIRVLDEDRTGVNPDNLIEEEMHTLDVPNGRQVIRPATGAFWQHDIVIVNDADETVLIQGTDYEIVGMNRPKTAIAEHPSAVYDYIFVTAPIVGTVRVTYRAFGGSVSIHDINSIKDVLISIVDNIQSSGYLTEENIGNLSLIVGILNDINELQDDVYHYVTAMHTYAAPTDGKHWFTIGSLYRDNWDTETLKQGSVHLGIKSFTRQWQYDVLLSIGLERLDEPLKVNVLSSSDTDNQFEMDSYDMLPEREVPQLRLVWKVEPGGVYTGALLQIAQEHIHDEQEVLLVTDKSGTGSDFNVRPNIVGDDVTVDDDIDLPNGSIWQDGEPDNFEARALLCPIQGYLAWAGALPLHLVDVDAPAGVTGECTVVLGDFEFSNIKKVTTYIYDRISDEMIVKSDDHFFDDSSNPDVKTGTILFNVEDLCSISYSLKVNDSLPETIAALEISADLGTHSILNERFDLRQVVFHC